MVEIRVKGSVDGRGKVKKGRGFSVERLDDHSKGWRRYRVVLEGIDAVTYVEKVKSTSSRRVPSSGAGESVPDKARASLEKMELASSSFVVVSGYTREPAGPVKAGHHGFAFVAVGEGPGG